MGGSIYIDKEWLQHEYCALLRSSVDIAKDCKCSKPTVLKSLKKYGIDIRDCKQAHNTPVYLNKFIIDGITKEQLIDLYVVHKKVIREVAHLYSCSTACIRNRMMEYGIPIRRGCESIRILVDLGERSYPKMTPEQVEKNRLRQLSRYADPSEREKTALATRKAHKDNPDLRLRMAETTRSRYANSPELHEIASVLSKKVWNDPERRRKAGIHAREMWNNPELRAKMIASHKKLWASNSEVFINMRKKMIAGLNLSPNKPETAVLNILNNLFPNQWKYTGDGKMIIGGLNPDFTNVNGKKLVIEVFGDYWHTQKLKPYRINEGRVDVYAEYGYKTLIIWEHEVKDYDNLVKTIVSFCSNHSEVK